MARRDLTPVELLDLSADMAVTTCYP
jgi:hypothetical protein